jgi:hypothetical protein
VKSLLEDDDLQILRSAAPSRLGGGTHPGRVSADHQQPFAHGANLSRGWLRVTT